MDQPVNCKYTPLENHLRKLTETHSTITLTFDQIEHAMNSPLPRSAYGRQSWWDNIVKSTLSHKNAWLHAGWQVEMVDLSAKYVRLVRTLT